MNRLLAIDPGVTFTGAALFDRTTKLLAAAKRFKGSGFHNKLWSVLDLARDISYWDEIDRKGSISALVMEWPQVYAGRQRGRKDPNDLLPLAALDGMLLALLDQRMLVGADCEIYRPHDWKGSKKPNPCAQWVLNALDGDECARIEGYKDFLADLNASDKAGEEVSHPAHNTVDAVGIGLKYLGRLERKLVIHR